MRVRVLDVLTIASGTCALVLTGLFVRGEILGSGPAQGRPEARPIQNWAELVEGGHRIGAPAPSLTILEFGDYECPACREFHKTVERLLSDYPDEFALVYRHWPLERHLYAYDAARAAECAAEQGKFWQFHRRLFEEPRWANNAFVRFAREVEIKDVSAFEKCTSSPDIVPSIEEDIATIRALDGFGTPTLIVNGELMGSTPSFKELADRIEGFRSK